MGKRDLHGVQETYEKVKETYRELKRPVMGKGDLKLVKETYYE